PDPDHTSRLVLILRDLDPAFVRQLWDAFLGRPRSTRRTPCRNGPDPDHTSRLVLILRDLDPAFVRQLWDAFLGRPR
ncbi:hypothetical protein CTI14_69675, partial [Methylobacterium radiotolerans]